MRIDNCCVKILNEWIESMPGAGSDIVALTVECSNCHLKWAYDNANADWTIGELAE